MQSADLSDFTATFHRLGGVFRLYGEGSEVEHKISAYFKALRRFDLPDVAAGADVWIQRGKHFPKPSEWIASIPRVGHVELRMLTYSEAVEHTRAERLHYEDEACGCQSCKEAGVDHRPLRFVPEADEHGADSRARIEGRDKPAVIGHWAHGWELARWYVARDAFMAEFEVVKAKYGTRF